MTTKARREKAHAATRSADPDFSRRSCAASAAPRRSPRPRPSRRRAAGARRRRRWRLRPRRPSRRRRRGRLRRLLRRRSWRARSRGRIRGVGNRFCGGGGVLPGSSRGLYEASRGPRDLLRRRRVRQVTCQVPSGKRSTHHAILFSYFT